MTFGHDEVSLNHRIVYTEFVLFDDLHGFHMYVYYTTISNWNVIVNQCGYAK